MTRTVVLVLAAAAPLALAAAALVRPARRPQPAVAESTTRDRASPASVVRQAASSETARGDAGSAQSPPVAAYREQLASAKRAFAAEPRDPEWAPQAEGQLRAAIESARAERPAQGTAGRDLQVECRTRHCRLSVPIPPGQGVASLPVVAEMAGTLQRAHGAIAVLGRIVGENAEPSDPGQRRRYALYLRREPAPPAPPAH